MQRMCLWGSISLVVILVGVSWFLAKAQGVPFSDIERHAFRDDIVILYNKGVVSGYSDGTFGPDNTINRAEFLKILMKAVFGESDALPTSKDCFADFNGEEQWYWGYACRAKEKGIIGGYPDGTFQGERTVNLVEALKMVGEAIQGPASAQPSSRLWPASKATAGKEGVWYAKYWDLAREHNLFAFLPETPSHLLTRAEISALIVRFIKSSPNEAKEAKEASEATLFNRRSLVPIRSPNLDFGEPVRHAAMRIEQMTLTDRNVSAGTADVPLLRFRAVAGRQDVAITSLIFEAASGSLQTATNYQLFYGDSDGPVIHFPGLGKLQGNRLVFAPLDLPLEDGFEKTFEVHADMTEDPSEDLLALRFALSDAQYVHAVGRIDGRELTGITTDNVRCPLTYSICWIEVFTAPPSRVTVSAKGNLFVTTGSISTRSRQLLLGGETGPLLTLNFRAEREDIEVRSLKLEGISSSIDTVDILIGSLNFRGYRSGCTAFSANRICVRFPAGSVIIPRERDIDIEVWGNLKADVLGGNSGETAQLQLSAATSTADHAIEAWGRASDRDLSQNDGDTSGDGEIFIGRAVVGANVSMTGPIHDTVAALLDQIGNSNPDPDGTAVPFGIYPIGEFSFHAAPHDNRQGGLNRVRIRDLVFQVAAVNTTMNPQGFKLLRKDNPSLSVGCTANAATGIITVTCADLEESVLTPLLTPGQSLHIVLQGEVTALQVAGGSSSLQVRLNPLNDRIKTGAVTWDDEEITFSWVDMEESAVQSTAYRTP